MDGSVIGALIGSLITTAGLYMVSKVNTKGSNDSSTVKSALELQKRYEEINKENSLEMKEMRTKMDSLEKQVRDMQKQFEEKENYYKIELEKKDDEIDELEKTVNECQIIIVKKDLIISELKGGA